MNIPFGGGSPILEAIRFGRIEETYNYILGGYGIDSPVGEHYPSALHAAAFFSQEDIIAMLLRHNAGCRIQNAYGSTALHIAGTKGNTRIIQMLAAYSHGEPMQKNHRGRTPLHNVAANIQSSLQAVQTMLEYSSDSDVLERDNDGKMPNYYAETRDISNLLQSAAMSAIQKNMDYSRISHNNSSHSADHPRASYPSRFLPGLGFDTESPGRMPVQNQFDRQRPREEDESQDFFKDYEESEFEMQDVNWLGEATTSPDLTRRRSNASFDSDISLNWNCDQLEQDGS
jgi:hypothetical protein